MNVVVETVTFAFGLGVPDMTLPVRVPDTWIGGVGGGWVALNGWIGSGLGAAVLGSSSESVGG